MMPMSRDNNAIASQPRGRKSPQRMLRRATQDQATGNWPSGHGHSDLAHSFGNIQVRLPSGHQDERSPAKPGAQLTTSWSQRRLCCISPPGAERTAASARPHSANAGEAGRAQRAWRTRTVQRWQRPGPQRSRHA
jgi:hypothetical protein